MRLVKSFKDVLQKYSNEKFYLIIGSGLTGSTIARRIASEKQAKVVVVEQRDHIGGNCYDYVDSSSGIRVHKYGPHVFHTSKDEVWLFLSKYTKWEPFFYRVKAIIDGNEVGIPFNLDSLYQCFPMQIAKNIELSLLNKYKYGERLTIGQLLKENDSNLAFLSDFIKRNVFDGYSEKQWGLKIDELDSSVSDRVPVLISRDNRYFQDKYCAIPKNGYTDLIRNLLNHDNITVYTNIKAPSFSELYNNMSIIKTFHSGPIDEFNNYVLGELPYRSLDIRFTLYNREYYQSCAQINYPNDQDFTRSVEYKYYLNETSKNTVVSREYPCDFSRDSNLERFYPISTQKSEELYKKYIDLHYSNLNIKFVGRLGCYKYMNMDECVYQAINMII